jgi:hypothetical protein
MNEYACKSGFRRAFESAAEYVSMGFVSLMVLVSTLRLLGLLS